MKRSVLFLGSAIGLFLFAMAGLMVVAFAGWVSAAEVAAPPGAESESQFVSRVISIPFGIDASLPVVDDGNAVEVSGHGTCPEGGQSYQLRVEVVQPQTGTRGMGSTAGDCLDGASLTWQATAMTPPPLAFEAGPAEACAMVQVFFDRAGTIVHRWCVDVTLQ